MPHAPRALALASLVLLAAGCSSPRLGTLSVGPRGAVTGDWLLFLLSASESESDPGEGRTYTGSGDLTARSLGLRATLNTEIVDLVVGTDWHRIGDDRVRETSVGLRGRQAMQANSQSYVEVLLRRGHGYDSPSGSVDYDGMEVGIGVLGKLSDHWYLDAGLSAEWTFDRLEVDAGERREHFADFLLHCGVVFVL